MKHLELIATITKPFFLNFTCRRKQKGGKRRGKVIAVNDAPCRGCVSREVGCHAGSEKYKAYADGRKTALENRYTACIEGAGRKRSHER